jgi:hypothetical protein
MQKTLLFIKYFFFAGFGRFCLNPADVQPPIFPANHFIFSAGFELFCKIFGRFGDITTEIN